MILLNEMQEYSERSLERTLWEAADKLRKNMDAAEYKHIVLGLVFLKWISVAFLELHRELEDGGGDHPGADPEDVDEYRAHNVFYVPPKARWNYLQAHVLSLDIGDYIADANRYVEEANPSLQNLLYKRFNDDCVDPKCLGQLIDLIDAVPIGDTNDLLGKVYEYFLGQFALAEGKKGGQFYTPSSIVELMVKMMEPYEGRVYDPCCGSGGMFVHSEAFVLRHRGRLDDISIYGQESNATTYKLCRMNLAIRGIDASNIKWNNEGSFHNDAHPFLEADYVMANPPFNDSDWNGAQLNGDARWQYGEPNAGNSNYAWIQHMLYHLAPDGVAGIVLANGSLTSRVGNEGRIRAKLVDAGLVDCIVALPDRLFYNTAIPACLWFLKRTPAAGIEPHIAYRRNHTLFIDARGKGDMINRKNRVLTADDTDHIAHIYKCWRSGNGSYEDQAGLNMSVSIERIKANDYQLLPSLYVGGPTREPRDKEHYRQHMMELTTQLTILINRGAELDREILANLADMGYKHE